MNAAQLRELRQAKHDADLAAEYFADHMTGREYDTSTALISAYIDCTRRYLADLLKAQENAPPAQPDVAASSSAASWS